VFYCPYTGAHSSFLDTSGQGLLEMVHEGHTAINDSLTVTGAKNAIIPPK